MSDRPLQEVQDTIRIPVYSDESDGVGTVSDFYYGQRFINLIPEVVPNYIGENKRYTLSKRPGIESLSTDFMTTIVNDINACTVLDFITITALSNVHVAAVYDESDGNIYIIQVRFGIAPVKIGSFAGTSQNDYVFLSEISQASGNLYPAVAVSWTDSTRIGSSKGFYAISSGVSFTATTLTQITNLAFPPNQTPALITIGHFIQMNGTVYIATTNGQIWNSYVGQNDISDWDNATSQIGFISVSQYPDTLVGLARYKHHIVAMGANSIEFYNDVGDTPCPLARTDQAFIKFGCYSPRMVKNINDTLYWLAYGDSETTGIWKLEGYTPIKISYPALDRAVLESLVNAGADLSKTNFQVTKLNGKVHLLLNGVTQYTLPYIYTSGYPTKPAGFTVADDEPVAQNDFLAPISVYNTEDGLWWNLGLFFQGIRVMSSGRYMASGAAGSFSELLLLTQDVASGINIGQTGVYRWRKLDTYLNQDDVSDSNSDYYPNQPIATVWQTNLMWFGNEKRKRISRLKIICRQEPKYSADFATVYSRYIWYTKESRQLETLNSDIFFYNGYNFPTGWSRDYFNNFGMGRSWTFVIAEKSRTTFKYDGLELDMTQGAH